MEAPEFTHVVPLDRLTASPRRHRLVADEAARAALARRFDLVSIERLEADLEVSRAGAGAVAAGPMRAAVVQRCVISGEPVGARIETMLDLRFEPGSDTELVLTADAPDPLPVDEGRIDLGEALAQSLALALDPWPRAGEAQLAEARRHLISEAQAEAASAAIQAEVSPFAILKGRRREAPDP